MMKMLRFYTTEQLGEKQALTPEGFLLCLDVPIARTGRMIYGPDETPIPPGPNGVVTVVRDEEEVFRPEFIASFNGKPIVDDHPSEDVNPSNWKQYAVGTAMNPRRGSGMQMDLLIADIIISDEMAIKAIREGKREVSCGYDADYEEIAPGEGKQKNMVGNHIALVEAGRCGSRCSIGDRHCISIPKTGDISMRTLDEATVDSGKWFETFVARVREAFKSKDEAKLEEVLKDKPRVNDQKSEEEEKELHLHVHPGASEDTSADAKRVKDEETEGRIKKLEEGQKETKDSLDAIKHHLGMDQEKEGKEIEGRLKEEAPAGTGDKAAKATDSALLEDSFQDTVAAAEIIAPGIRIPAFDRAAKPTKMLDVICNLRRAALDLANNQPETRGIIEDLNGKPLELGQMSCSEIKPLFKSVASLRKTANNSKNTRAAADMTKAAGGLGVKGPISSPAQLNKRMSEIYKPRA